MDIRPLDIADASQVRDFWWVGKTVDAHETAYPSLPPFETAHALLTRPNRSRELILLAAYDEGRMVGALASGLPLLDNLTQASLEIHVLPEHRRRGFGTALLAAALPRLAAAGRSVLTCEVITPTVGEESAGLGFAKHHGFTEAIMNDHRVLDLAGTRDRWRDLAADCAPHHEGYTLVSWQDRVPEEHLAGYCAIQYAFNLEAPMGEHDLEAEQWDEARVRDKEQRFRAAGRHELCTVAIAPDGTLAGLTELIVTDGAEDQSIQGATLVLRAHRGHRLGLALKATNLLALLESHPGCEFVQTWNADVNQHMNAINERLGFRVVDRLAEMRRELP